MAALALLATVVAAGCVEQDETTDAGGDRDGGARDGGTGADAGPGSDGRVPDDASLGVDAGVPFADAGDLVPDDGGLGQPEWVDLTVGPPGTCDAFTPCGGDVVGTWDTAGGCFDEVDVEGSLEDCPGAEVTRYSGRGRGRVTFDGTYARRVAQAWSEVEIFYPALCARYYSCAMLESAMAAAVDEARCFVHDSGDCTCIARELVVIDHYDAYTIEGNEIVSSSSGKRWAYCIDGDAFYYEDTSPSGSREPGTVELVRR